MYLGSSAAPLPVAFAAAQAESFSGTGAQAAFTLSRSVLRNIDIEVIVNNVQQSPYDGSYSINGTTLTFSENPSAGTNNIYVIYRDQPVGSINPIDGSVTTAKLAANAVTPAKMANSGAELGMRNRIINGAMVVDQRNNGNTLSVSNTTTYGPDRWWLVADSTGVFQAQQVSDAPAGFSSSLKITVTTAATTVGSNTGYRAFVAQTIEGYNVADLGFGAAGAATVTISFWVKSSLTGAFPVCVENYSGNRGYPTTFTINSANTWEYKTITIQGDTTGTWDKTNTGGTRLMFALGEGSARLGTANTWATGPVQSTAGAQNIINTLNATIQFTGVQLEKGSTATSFDYRPYGTELALCQRYYQVNDYHQVAANTSSGDGTITLPVQMRAAPALNYTDYAGTPNTYSDSSGNGLTYSINAIGVAANRIRPQVALSRACAWWGFNYTLSAEF